MTVETASYISQLNPSYPAAGDPKSEGDDHLRLTKTVLQTQFSNLGAAAVTATAAQLNDVVNKAVKTGDTYTGTHDFTGATINVPTASASDNDANAASTAMVQAAILASSGVTAVLPGQGGNSGKFLTTNGTAASWASVPGQSGTTITGNVTLTASSAAGMSVTPTSPGLYATLPDATTCSKATTLFSIYNAGDYDYGVKDSAGTQLGWVRARTGAMIGLADNSTAAGTWAYYGLEKLGITAQYINASISGNATIKRVAIDATRTLIIFGNTTIYGIVLDSSTATWGSATSITGVGTYFNAILSTTNQVLVVSGAGTIEAVTLTLSGTSITVNSGTKATVTPTAALSGLGQIIAVGSSWVFSYNMSSVTTKGIRAITLSGTTPTIGSEATIVNTYTADAHVPCLYASGSVVRTVTGTAAGTISATPYTVSGTTLTVGTAANITRTTTAFRTIQNGNGNIVCHYQNSAPQATIFKLTSTTEAASTVAVNPAYGGATLTIAKSDYFAVSAGKTALIAADTGSFSVSIVTDTAGTASVGTELAQALSTGTTNACIAYSISGNIARFAYGIGSDFVQVVVDCSGTSATLVSVQKMNYGTSDLFYSGQSTNYIGDRSGEILVTSNGVYAPPRTRPGLASYANSTKLIQPWSVAGNSALTAGAANESFSTFPIGSSAGQGIQRIEAAA